MRSAAVRRPPGVGRTRPATPRPPAPPTDPIELLTTPIGASGLSGAATLRRIGPRLGIAVVRDLLFHLPRRYDDRREMRTIAALHEVADGEQVSARVTVTSIRVEQTFRRRLQKTVASVEDGTGTAEAVWFGRRYIERRIKPGDRLVLSGRLRTRGFAVQFDDPEFQPEDGHGDLLHAGRIVPIYRLTSGLVAPRLRLAIREAIDRAGRAYPEYLPGTIRAEEGLVGIERAIEHAHYPDDPTGMAHALRRLAFDELFALQLGMVARRRQRGRSRATPVIVDNLRDLEVRTVLRAVLSQQVGREISLTVDQLDAMSAIRTDLARPEPMLRLLQGDVGSGKTAVAAHALALAASAGRQGVVLAPTDLLARQHARTLGQLLEPLGIPVALLTGSLSAVGTRQSLAVIADGRAPVVVGTHALLQPRVRFADLGLVVIDEQHRFGVEQRGLLEAKTGGPRVPLVGVDPVEDGAVRSLPHVLLMTATPIPRTLGQVLYADLDVTDLRTPPAGRLAIRTGLKRSDDLAGTWARVREEAAAGHRTFVVVPLIEASDDEGAIAAETEAARLRIKLAPLRVGLVHGRLKAAVRDDEMGRFRDGELDVLVGTTVVEVGVDVPEATLMIVLGADRFGLAQLHQLRGRVGRGSTESFCVLVSDTDDPTALARLNAVRELRDGFALAEADFELRREGDVLGLVQSGLPRLRVASLQRQDHRVLAGAARRHAEALLDESGELPGLELAALRHELTAGWLEGIAAADPASGT